MWWGGGQLAYKSPGALQYVERLGKIRTGVLPDGPLCSEKMGSDQDGCVTKCTLMWRDRGSDKYWPATHHVCFHVMRWWLFPCVWGFWENVRQFIPCLCFKKHFVFVFIKVDISLCKLIPLFRPGSVHRGSASWDNFDRVFSDKLRVSLFPDRFPHSALIAT